MTSVMDTVQAWVEAVIFPTYEIGQPDKNPMFLEKRVYQGSSGAVYPYPVVERVADQPVEKSYQAVFLENRYLKIMILPELGGRVQMAQDKTNGYHFIYYNRVIKPALVGLAGPWISGGIEFNWPQHHRPSTFAPVNWRITPNPDGSQTVWCSEIERMFFTSGTHGFTLYPNRAYLEINVQLYNRTSEPQTFLWWANPAVHVNDDYQSVFPPDVHAVMDHGKRDVSDFPIATGTYYKVNYAPGTDISRYKNIPVPTSYMAHHSDFDFVGDYDHGRQAGMLHVANHHLVPGKKQWTWGNSDFGQAWDRQLTDADGPYIELMCGAFTDNQPDFSWLMPGEEKRFTQTFLPYKAIGPAKHASRDVVLNLELEGQTALVGVYVTQPREARVALYCAGKVLWETTASLSPEQVLTHSITLPPDTRPPTLTVSVFDVSTQHELISFTPRPAEAAPIPAPAQAAKPPSEIASNEELFLNGLHLEQYRHATYAPEPYYEEALRRDPGDSRCNNALGLLLYRRGKFAEAEPYFRKAIESLTRRNPNPYDGEPYYNLGLSLKQLGRYREAFDAFYKAAWNAAWQDSAYFELAQLAARSGDITQALDLAHQALRRNWSHHKARHLKIALLRRMGRTEAAQAEVGIALELNVMDVGVRWEQKLLTAESTQVVDAAPLAPHTAVEVGLDYQHAGLFEEATVLFSLAAQQDTLAQYFKAACVSQWIGAEAALSEFQRAARLSPDYVFPHRLESVSVLTEAMRVNPGDARAPYYLGNFWYAHRRYAEAIECWERARELDPDFPTTHRNLGLAYFNKRQDAARAYQAYERAFALNPDDARVLYELDQLEKKLNRLPEERLARLSRYPALIERRDDLTIEYVTLLNMLGRHPEAYPILMRRQFHPWEGGEGKTTGQYVISLIEQAKKHLAAHHYREAVETLKRAQVYPHHLGEGKLPNIPESHVYYYLGLALAGLGAITEAHACYEKASLGLREPTSAIYYNDQPPEMVFYQGLAQHQLGHALEARRIFQKLVEYGQAHLNDHVTLDYFAVSLPTFLVFDEDLDQRNQIHCHYLMGLGHLGLGDTTLAQAHFNHILALDANHQGARMHHAFQPTF